MRTKTLSRRGFLGRSLAACAAPVIVSSSVLGRAGAVAPSDRITMGFIGLGGQGSGHLGGGAWTYLPGGYLATDDWKRGRIKIKIKPGTNDLGTIKLDPSLFAK